MNATVPARAVWPEPAAQTEAGVALTDLILTTFELHGRVMAIAEELGAAGDLTASWWRVLGGVIDQPRSVAEVGRRMGMTRQGVQRTADLLVKRGLAEYQPNPEHRRAKLLTCTESGFWAIRQISVAQHPWSNRIGGAVGAADLASAVATMRRVLDALDAD